MSKFIIFDNDILYSLGLSMIREVGRQAGLQSPTTKSSEELAKEIMLKQRLYGQIKIDNKIKPSKSVDVTMFYCEEEEEDEEKAKRRENENTFVSDVYVLAEGLLEERIEGHGFLRHLGGNEGNTDAYVPEEVMKLYKLRGGDYIVAPARSDQDGVWIIDEIYFQNGMDHRTPRQTREYQTLLKVLGIEEEKRKK